MNEDKVIAEFEYDKVEVEHGYANRTLYVNVGDNSIEIKPVTEEMKEKFVGGKGFDLYLMWHAVDPGTKWNDPENELCISCGPLGGTPMYPGSGKSIVTSISPLTGIPIDSNVGGYFGPYLKFGGFDALELQGKAESDVIIYIDGIENKIRILDGSDLPEESHLICKELTERFGGDEPRGVSVVSAGPGADHTYMGCLNFSWYDVPRKIVRYKQAGRGGTGTVFRDKKIKALVARAPRVRISSNAPAEEEKLKEVAREHSKEIRELDPKQNDMAKVGTTHLVTIMNDYDLLPTKNYQYGRHPDAPKIGEDAYRKLFDPGFDGCWLGCTVACAHGIKDLELKTGPHKGERVFVDGPEYETIAGMGSNWGIFDAEYIAEGNFYCDTYGLDTISVGTAIAFVMECYERGFINKEDTGGLDLKFGSKEAAMELVHQMARNEGFGAIVGKGIRYMKDYFHENFGADRDLMEDIGMECKGLEYSEYVTKESLAQQGGYGLALKGPQHDEAWLIFLDQVHNFMPTFEQKAEALHWFPMWRTWFSLNGLCKLPWNDIVPADNQETDEPAKVMKHVEWYATYFSSVTGKEVDPEALIEMSERIYNFQRVFNLRMGQGTREHDRIPYRSAGPVTNEEYESRTERYDKQLREIGVDTEGMSVDEKRKALRDYREDRYEKLIDAVYKRRGWNENGIPTEETLERLGIAYPFVLEAIKKAT